MATNTIDNLSLYIDIQIAKDVNQRLSSLTDSILALNEAVKDVANFNKYAKVISRLQTSLTKTTTAKAVNGTANILKTQEVEVDTSGYDEANAKMKEAETQSEATAEQVQNLEKDINKTSVAAKSLSSVATATKNMGKAAKSSMGFWKKFTRSLGRIALYRIVRSLLSKIASAAKEGFTNFVQYSDEANESMSNIMNTINQIKNTLGVTLGNLVTTFEPLITTLLDGINSFIEAFNMAMAAISGKSTYTRAIKQNEDYAESLEDVNSQLLSFDSFEALNSDDSTDVSLLYEEVELPDELTGLASVFKDVLTLLQQIWTVVKNIGEAFVLLWDNGLRDIVSWFITGLEYLSDWVKKIISFLDNIGGLKVALAALIVVLTAIYVILVAIGKIGWVSLVVTILTVIITLLGLIITYWDDIVAAVQKAAIKIAEFLINAWKKIANGFASVINNIVNGFVSLVNTIIDGINAIISPIDKVAGWFGGSFQISHWNYSLNWQPYADGGTFDKGTAFIAGEKGAEIVYNSGNGGGGVANIEQIAQAMYQGTYQALADYGVSRGDLSNLNGMYVYMNGKKVGQVVENAVYSEGVRVGHFKKV